MPAALQVLVACSPSVLAVALVVARSSSGRPDLSATSRTTASASSRSCGAGSGSVHVAASSRSHGEAGFQPDVLRGGLHLLPPFQYRVHSAAARDDPAGQDRLRLRARRRSRCRRRRRSPRTPDGARLPGRPRVPRERRPARPAARGSCARARTRSTSRSSSSSPTAGVYYLPLERQDEATLRRDGARSSPSATASRRSSSRAPTTSIGVVTVHDGPSLAAGRDHRARSSATIRPTPATYHNNFQDPERFLAAGGRRGRQLQVLVEGTYYINRLFATVELDPEDRRRGRQRRRRRLVHRRASAPTSRAPTTSTASSSSTGERGVWSEPLLPGKYAFNTYAGKVIMVPTTNFILKWIAAETGVAQVRREPVRGRR